MSTPQLTETERIELERRARSRSGRAEDARGVFTSVNDLRRKLMRYIRHYNKAPKTVKWKYGDPTRRIHGSNSGVTGH